MKWIRIILEKTIGSLDTVTIDSFSGRKLTAFAGVLTGIYITIANVKADNALYFLQSWQVFSLLCLGIVTADSLIKLFIETKSNGKVPEV